MLRPPPTSPCVLQAREPVDLHDCCVSAVTESEGEQEKEKKEEEEVGESEKGRQRRKEAGQRE